MKTVYTLLLVTLTTVSLACGYSAKMTPPSAGTAPAISQLNPANATAGSAAFTLIVNGSNFGSKAVVNWNGVAQTTNTTFVTGNQLTVAVPASAIAASGAVQITVTNPAVSGTGMYGSGGALAATSTAMSFTIN